MGDLIPFPSKPRVKRLPKIGDVVHPRYIPSLVYTVTTVEGTKLLGLWKEDPYPGSIRKITSNYLKWSEEAGPLLYDDGTRVG